MYGDIGILKEGNEAYSRLSIINKVCNPFSLQFIDSLKLPFDLKVLEIGCGHGQMALELSKRFNHITATDVSLKQLALAKNLLYEHCNIAFEVLDLLKDNFYKKKYDLIYIRLVLMHLPNSEHILNCLSTLLEKDGALIIEEPDATTFSSNSAQQAFLQWNEICLQLLTIASCDAKFGKSLPDLIFHSTLKIKQQLIVTPSLRTPYEKSFMRLGMIEAYDKIMKHQLITESALDELNEQLRKIEDDTHTIISFMNMHQYLLKF